MVDSGADSDLCARGRWCHLVCLYVVLTSLHPPSFWDVGAECYAVMFFLCLWVIAIVVGTRK